MKKVIVNLDKINDSSELIIKFLLGNYNTTLMAVTTRKDMTEYRSYLNKYKAFIPLRYGREKEEKFYSNEAARFISGNTREHENIYLLIKDSLDNFLDALRRDAYMDERIKDIIVLDRELLLTMNEKDYELLKGKSFRIFTSKYDEEKILPYLSHEEIYKVVKAEFKGMEYNEIILKDDEESGQKIKEIMDKALNREFFKN